MRVPDIIPPTLVAPQYGSLVGLQLEQEIRPYLLRRRIAPCRRLSVLPASLESRELYSLMNTEPIGCISDQVVNSRKDTELGFDIQPHLKIIFISE